MINNKLKLNNKGFTLIEILVYIFITAMLLLVISGLVQNNFNARKQLKISDTIQHNVQFITNFMSNRIHNAYSIENVNPAPEQILFYTTSSTRFSLTVESGDLIYRETKNIGGSFPEQSTADPIILNTDEVTVSDLVLTPIADSHGNANQGINLNMTFTIGTSTDLYGYAQQTLNTFISIR